MRVSRSRLLRNIVESFLANLEFEVLSCVCSVGNDQPKLLLTGDTTRCYGLWP